MSEESTAQAIKNKKPSLSTYEKVSLAISLVSMVSLGLIWYQIKQTSMSLQASALATIGNYTMDLDKIFIADPKLRKYFYNREPITKESEDYDKVMAIAEFQLDFFDATMTQLDIRPSEGFTENNTEKETWNRYFSDSFANSPALCQRFRELSVKGWYRQNLEDIGNRQCGEQSK